MKRSEAKDASSSLTCQQMLAESDDISSRCQVAISDARDKKNSSVAPKVDNLETMLSLPLGALGASWGSRRGRGHSSGRRRELLEPCDDDDTCAFARMQSDDEGRLPTQGASAYGEYLRVCVLSVAWCSVGPCAWLSV